MIMTNEALDIFSFGTLRPFDQDIEVLEQDIKVLEEKIEYSEKMSTSEDYLKEVEQRLEKKSSQYSFFHPAPKEPSAPKKPIGEKPEPPQGTQKSR
jgi:hypothetical protein